MEKYSFMDAVDRMKNGQAVTNTYQSYRGEDCVHHFVIENGALLFKKGSDYAMKNLQESELTNVCWHDFDISKIEDSQTI